MARTDVFQQRPALQRFAESLDSRASALRRDACGDWAIFGSNGHIYAAPEGFQLMIGCDFDNTRWTSARGWESAKKRLGFGKVTQDGDCEGSIILDRLPSKSEGAEIRDILGIPKRVELSEGQLANLRAHAAANAFKPLLPASADEQATIATGRERGRALASTPKNMSSGTIHPRDGGRGITTATHVAGGGS
jgi:hypothetical protein